MTRRARIGRLSDLGHGGDSIAPRVDEGRIGPHQPRAIPTVRKPDVDLVAAGLQVFADIVGLVGEPLVVAGPAGREQVVPDPPAVDETAVEPKRGDIEALAASDRVELERLAKERRSLSDARVRSGPHHFGEPRPLRLPLGFPGRGRRQFRCIRQARLSRTRHQRVLCRPFYTLYIGLHSLSRLGPRFSIASRHDPARLAMLLKVCPCSRSTNASRSARSRRTPASRWRRCRRCCATPTGSAPSSARKSRPRSRSLAIALVSPPAPCAGGPIRLACCSPTSAIRSSPTSSMD